MIQINMYTYEPKFMDKNAHSSTFYNNQIESSQMATDRMDKLIVLYSYHGTLHSKVDEWTHAT